MFDLDGPQLIALLGSAGGHYLSGRALEPAPHFFAGAVSTRRAAVRIPRATGRDESAGRRRFLQLQICYRPELLERFMREASTPG